MSESGESGRSAPDKAEATELQTSDSAGTILRPDIPDQRPLSETARRALAEAEARRAAYEAQVASLPKELGGRGGKEPGRYGDWEVKGIATDF